MYKVCEPVTKHLDGEIWELRPLRNRFLYAYYKDNRFVILHHFLKKTQKTPKREIEQAKKIYKIIWKGMSNMTTWKELKNDLLISQEDISTIELEKDLIRTMVAIREEKGLTQSQLAEICNVKQPVIARLESSVHSPQIDSLLKILVPLGYNFTDCTYGGK